MMFFTIQRCPACKRFSDLLVNSTDAPSPLCGECYIDHQAHRIAAQKACEARLEEIASIYQQLWQMAYQPGLTDDDNANVANTLVYLSRVLTAHDKLEHMVPINGTEGA